MGESIHGGGRLNAVKKVRDRWRCGVWCGFMWLALPCAAADGNAVNGMGLETQASGVFLNAAGEVLTARHAVTGCEKLFALKDGRVVQARVRAVSAEHDLAVISTGLIPYLSATLVQTPPSTMNSIGVFAEAYGPLQKMPDRARILSNAITVPSNDGMLLLSGAKPGASGSAVLNGSGLLLGMVVERISAGTGSAGAGKMPGAVAHAGSGTQVRAVTAAQIADFLRASDIVFSASDAAQLAATQSAAARAMTLSAGIICG